MFLIRLLGLLDSSRVSDMVVKHFNGINIRMYH